MSNHYQNKKIKINFPYFFWLKNIIYVPNKLKRPFNIVDN